MGVLRNTLLIAAVVLGTGCGSSNRNTSPSHVAVARTDTTRPAGSGGGGGSAGSSNQRVEIAVRDTNAAGFASSIFGRTCRVQFRRDALGIAGNAAIGPTQDWGGRMSVDGKIVDVTDQWIVLSAEKGKRLCVPLMSVLVVEVQD